MANIDGSDSFCNEMPEAEDGFVKTLNNTGYMTIGLDRFSRMFVEYAATTTKPALDVGAAYGVATVAALERGATVVANDCDERHLQVLYQRVSDEARHRLLLLPGNFPELDLQDNSFSAVLICRVLHFFDGDSIERSARAVYRWLVPGGKVFVVSETPFVGTLRKFAAEYDRRKEAGHAWPGLILDMQAYTPRASALPKLGNWLDVDVLTRVFSESNFSIEECAYFARPEFPEWLRLDGRESVGLIAVKPTSSR